MEGFPREKGKQRIGVSKGRGRGNKRRGVFIGGWGEGGWVQRAKERRGRGRVA